MIVNAFVYLSTYISARIINARCLQLIRPIWYSRVLLKAMYILNANTYVFFILLKFFIKIKKTLQNRKHNLNINWKIVQIEKKTILLHRVT